MVAPSPEIAGDEAQPRSAVGGAKAILWRIAEKLGALVTFGGLPPFIATLGMLGIAQGTALSLSKGYSMYGFPPSFEFIGGGVLFGIPFPLYILVVVALLMGFVFHHTRVGRYAYAI